MNNAAIEKYYFDLFARDFSLPLNGVTYADKPDVILRANSTIGIEIARLYIAPGTNPSSEQRQQPLRSKVIEAAKGLYLNGGGKKFEWTFSFDPTHPIKDTRDLASRLRDFARLTDSMPTGEIPRGARIAIPEVAFAYLNATEYEDAKWRLAQPYAVPSLQHGRVRELAMSKDVLLSGYAQCDKYWLLLIVDYMDPAQDQDITWGAAEDHVSTEFERLLIYRTISREITEVPVVRAA